jgi:methionyl-tRNA synthetase
MTSYYITTPIYYVNDVPHIGHAYTTLACDVLARFMRLDGREVHLLTGTDEHGQKVEKAAREAGTSPQDFTDRVSQNFRELAVQLGVSNDDFIRTTEARHKACCAELWRRMAAGKAPNGESNVYLGKYAGWYAVRDEAFYGEDELTVGADGRRRAPSGAEVEWVEEPSYFFRLSAWQDWLLDHYARGNTEFIGPTTRRNEVVSFVKQGLTDLSISRTTFTWGIPVPGDPAHIMYVWLDALSNYVSALGWPGNEDDPEGLFRRFWPADLHMVGKDIVRFHAVYWPAFLQAAGLPPPRRVFAHGWWTVEGQKMSKSLGNSVKPAEMIARYGLDQVRYFLLREVPFGQDGDFSQAAMARRINTDLANDLGNLAQRVLSFVQKNAGAEVPEPAGFTEDDRRLMDAAVALLIQVRAELAGAQAFHRALEAVFAVVADANRYVDVQAPWTLRKTDQARMRTVLYTLAETIRRIALLLQPFMPGSMARLLDQLAIAPSQRDFAAFDVALTPGTKLPPPTGVFPRLQDAAAS